MSDWWSMHEHGEATHYMRRKQRTHSDLVDEFNHRWQEMYNHFRAFVVHYAECQYCRLAVVGDAASLAMRLCDEADEILAHAFVNAGNLYQVRDALAADGHRLTLVHDPAPADNLN